MKLTEHCAVVGVATTEDASMLRQLQEGLSALQHRGQESVGISLYNGALHTFTSMGLLSESTIFRNTVKAPLGIGHERYSTTGRSTLTNAQPITMQSKHGIDYAFAFNGNLRNLTTLKGELHKGPLQPTESDTRLLAHLLGRDLGGKPVEQSYHDVAPMIDGSYSALILAGGKRPQITAIRDPLGIRPLCLGKRGDDYVLASESVAFADCYLDATFLRDVEPGEVVTLNDGGLHACKVFDCPRHGHCMFEWVYFARMDSVIEGIPVYEVREALGRALAEKAGVDADMVIPVPDSGRSAATGYAMASSIPLREIFQVDRYQYRRIFIMPDQAVREQKASKKLNVLPSIAKGKRVVVVDDSIVRGTNMRNMVINKLKQAGAKEIHVRISCPPLMDRCPYGVDFHRGELIASKHAGLTHADLCQQVGLELGATSLYYNTQEDLEAAIGLPADQLCMGCLTGVYPTVDWTPNDSRW
jgi:amidophosphoribosyltransferase